MSDISDVNNNVDVEKSYGTAQTIAKLRRLADALENGTPFEIQIAGNRVKMPPTAIVEFEYVRTAMGEEIEIELKWTTREG